MTKEILIKRFIVLFLSLIFVLCMASCGKKDDVKGKSYTLTVEENGYSVITTLTINGDKLTFKAVQTSERELDSGKMVTLKQTSTLTGFAIFNEDGTVSGDFNREGASATMKRIYSGDGADEIKTQLLEQINASYEDGAVKNAQLDVLNGKTVTFKFGNKIWTELGPSKNFNITVVLDEENGTFTYAEEE